MSELVATFDLDAPFVARRDFTFAGLVYAAGEAFPWREVADERQLRTLFRAMLVRNGTPAGAPPPPAVAAPPPAPPAPPPAKAKAKRPAAEA